jgi:H+/Cl- antiporter ClcA
MLIGFWVAGLVSDAYKISDTQHDWQSIWLVAAGIAAAVAVLFFLTFNQKEEDALRLKAE